MTLLLLMMLWFLPTARLLSGVPTVSCADGSALRSGRMSLLLPTVLSGFGLRSTASSAVVVVHVTPSVLMRLLISLLPRLTVFVVRPLLLPRLSSHLLPTTSACLSSLQFLQPTSRRLLLASLQSRLPLTHFRLLFLQVS